MVKNMAMLAVCPLFWSVARMPDTEPLFLLGTLFMIDAVLVDANIPFPRPMRKIRANLG